MSDEELFHIAEQSGLMRFIVPEDYLMMYAKGTPFASLRAFAEMVAARGESASSAPITQKEKETMSKHTPGPWRDVFDDDEDSEFLTGYILRGADGTKIIDACGCCDSPWIHSKADAALIKAAPKMLKALRNLLNDTQHREHACTDEDCPVRVAREVIAEAEGENNE